MFERYKSTYDYDNIINKFFDVLRIMDKAAYDYIFAENTNILYLKTMY